MRYTPTTLEVLKAARNLIEPDGSWIKEKYATNKQGESISIYHGDACKFCSLGAIYRAIWNAGPLSGKIGDDNYSPAHEGLAKVFNNDDVHPVNDARSTKHLHVLMAYDFAILIEEDKQERNNE